MAYSTSIKYSKKRKQSKLRKVSKRSRSKKNSKKNKKIKSDKKYSYRPSSAKKNTKASWQSKWTKKTSKKKKRKKVKEYLAKSAGVVILLIIIGLIWGLSYIQALSEDLPSRDDPFGKHKGNTSEIYDRNGQLLYRMFGEENHDPVDIEEVPDLLKWSYLAAEDIDFYSHNGVDLKALARCGVINMKSGAIACGGSTVTQQVVKQTSLSNEQRLERKIKEVILSLQIEKDRSKDEILEIYLTIAPEGSNIYGVKTAARFYFGKELGELNLAEMTILASIPQNPTYLSPTKSFDTVSSQKRVKERQMYVLDQMEKYQKLINKEYKAQNDTDEDLITDEILQEARDFKLVYKDPSFEINAPHFVFYAQNMLQSKNYNNGIPFTLSELETGGYKIYTTLNYDYQAYAEQQVLKGVNDYGIAKGGYNAALVAMDPKTGEILAMAGSKDYFAKSYPEGCTTGVDCKFEPNVNITNTIQSPGSSMKPMVYYKGIMDGIITPGSMIADVPIKIGNYEPKNYEGSFFGVKSARWMLAQSRNIPAIVLVNQIGIRNFVEEMQDWGYSTLTNPSNYGPSIAVGGSEIKLVDHAEAYGVFANEGKHTEHEVILKIEDSEGNIIYNHEVVSEQVADPRGVYLINHILNGKNGGPGDSWDGRDIAGKTGTSEDQKETLFATYTPEIVAVGWLGNNDNSSMRYGASGGRTTRPWVAEFVKLIGGSIPKTPFPRPAGITTKSVCQVAEELQSEESATKLCEGFKPDLAISGINAPIYVDVSSVLVCSDQKDKLARDIDISLNLTESLIAKYYRMTDPDLQESLDEWLLTKEEYGFNGPPVEYCDINRNPAGALKPWAVITSPAADKALEDKLIIDISAFSSNSDVTKIEIYLDDILLVESTKIPYTDEIELEPLSVGTHKFSVVVHDSIGEKGTTTINLESVGDLTFDINSTVGLNKTINIEYDYSGSKPKSVFLHADDEDVIECSSTSCKWVTPSEAKEVEIYITADVQGIDVISEKKVITVE